MGQLKSTGRPEANRRAATIRRLTEVDWDFATESSDSPFSAFHWHPCRFPSQVPSIAIGRLSNLGDVVLDPFMGSGTSIVEAQRLGRQSIGIDINPISCLMARAKTMIHPFSIVEKYIDLSIGVKGFFDHQIDLILNDDIGLRQEIFGQIKGFQLCLCLLEIINGRRG